MSSEAIVLLSVFQWSAAVIFLWAFFCVLAKRVDDGIVGKLMFSMLGFAALAVVVSPNNARALAILLMFVACVGVRHMWMKCIWGHIKAACQRWLFCEKIRQWKLNQADNSFNRHHR